MSFSRLSRPNMPPPALPPPSPVKRLRMSSSQSEVSSGNFSELVKAEVQRQNDNCFACGTEIIQVAHVIAKSAPSAPLLQQRGLINFDLRGL
ncbi:hypothetical protein NYO67_968 [Aspergillus flavus]|nr:hypothetical protein NYO67_968 [Aspergillus flavus]